jgi:hypothetical protein
VQAIRARSARIHWCNVTGGPFFVSSGEMHSYDVRAVVLSRVVVGWRRLKPDLSPATSATASMANDPSTRATQLYDRRRDEMSLDEIERIMI